MKKYFRTLLCMGLVASVNYAQAQQLDTVASEVQPNWESLSKHPIPDWLLDAKFGIYAHWGLYSVGLNSSEWLIRNMYNPEFQKGQRNRAIPNLEKLVGGTIKDGYGYKDLVPFFTAEKYDPDHWATVVKASGAKFAGFSIAHCDGFGLWDSDVYEWNVGKMGPKRDLYGEFVTALRKQDMKVIATDHMYRRFNWHLPPGKFRKQAVEENWDVVNPKYVEYYPNKYTGSSHEEQVAQWDLKIREVIKKYRPDVMWFDGGAYDETNRPQEIFSDYFNEANARGQEVHIINKRPGTTEVKYNFPYEFGMMDFEHGRDRPIVFERPFIDSLTLTGGSWGFASERGGNRSIGTPELLKNMIDSVSRGGAILLSLAPRADGTIPEAQEQTLLELGGWLQQNGEAIYATRRWKHASDLSPEQEQKKYHYKYRPGYENMRWHFDKMLSDEVRYTRSKDSKNLFVMTIGQPTVKTIVAKRLNKHADVKIKAISLLGYDGDIKWERTEEALLLHLPEKLPNIYSMAFKVEVERL